MKKRILFLISLLFFCFMLHSVDTFAQSNKNKTVHVKSYTKKDGTKVKSHYRSTKGSGSKKSNKKKKSSSIFIIPQSKKDIYLLNQEKLVA
jgi:hypothetical protein